MPVSVTDEDGRIAAKLSKDHFTVLDGKTPREIDSFEEKDAPYSVGFLIDISPSMVQARKHLYASLGENIARFITRGHNANEYFILAFGSSTQILMDWTRDVNSAVSALGNLPVDRPRIGTAFYDACYQAIDKVNQRSGPRRALILVTDAADNSSRHSYGELREWLKQSQVTLYVIFAADPLVDSLSGYAREVANQLTTISGGVRFDAERATEVNLAAV